MDWMTWLWIRSFSSIYFSYHVVISLCSWIICEKEPVWRISQRWMCMASYSSVTSFLLLNRFKATGGSLKNWLVLFYYIISRPLSQWKCVLSSLGFDAAGGVLFLLPHVPSCHVTSQTPLVLASFVLLAEDWCYVKAGWVWRLSLVPALQPWISFGFLSLVVNTNMSSWESSSIMLRKRHRPRWPGLSFVLGVWCDVNPVLKDSLEGAP